MHFHFNNSNESLVSESNFDLSEIANATASALSSVLSYEARMVFVVVNFVILCPLVGLFGIVTNIINIIVFIKQGFAETINISLLCLAMADLWSLIPLQWFAICANPWFAASDIPFSPIEIQSLTAGYPHICFTRIAGWITAFVAFERCLCVAVPFKVKTIITRKVVIGVNLAIYSCAFLSMLPVYTTAYYDWKFYPEKNKTLLGIVYTANKNGVLGISLFITDFAGPFSAFTIVIVCTVVIRVKLGQKIKWRQTAASTAVAANRELPNKEKKVVVMATTISVIFIVCFTPVSLLMTARSIQPELSIIGRYANLNWALFSFAFLMESVNSSINIFVYYNMSSKYKDKFRAIFFKTDKK